MDKERTYRALLPALLAAGVLALSIGFLTSAKKDFSENENRYLQAFPQLTWEAVESGSFSFPATGNPCGLPPNTAARRWPSP